MLCACLSALYTTCFREATFPTPWKEANLVLLDKPGGDPTTPTAYRPICLLDVEGKLFKRVIASRIDEHLQSGKERNDLSSNKYGFRSTTDALDRVCAGIRDTSPVWRRDRRLGRHQKRVQLGTVVFDKGRTGVKVRHRLLDVHHRFFPLGEEDHVRETGRNDGKDLRILRRAPGVGSKTALVEHRLRLRPHPDHSFRMPIVDVFRGQHPAVPCDRS